jgi:hypothetical protein
MARTIRKRTNAKKWTMLGLLACAVAAAEVGVTATVRATESAGAASVAVGPVRNVGAFAGRHGMPVDFGRALGVRSVQITSGRSTHQLILTGIDRAGQVVTATRSPASANVVNLDTGEGAYVRLAGPTTVTVPTGRFAISATIRTPLANPGVESQTLVLLPEVQVPGPAHLTLDARRGQQAVLRPDDATATQVEGGAYVVQQTGGGPVTYPAFPRTEAPEQLFLTPTGTRSDLKLHLYAQWAHRDVRPSPYVYGLVHTTAGIPQRPGHQVRRNDLATVSTRYAAQAVPACGGVNLGPVVPDAPVQTSFGLRLPTLATTRIEYLSPDVKWISELGYGDASCEGEFDVQFARPVSYPRPGRYAVSWNTAPFGPAVDQVDAPAQRHGDVIRVQLPMFADSQPGHLGTTEPPGAQGTTTLSRDGVPLGSSPAVGAGEFAVPAGPGRYQLTVRCTREVSWSKLSTEQQATWTFTAGTGSADPHALPLLTVRATPVLDAYNLAPGGALFPVPLRVTRAPGAPATPVARVALDVSYDEGGTWQPARVIGAEDDWAAMLRHPASGTVSLRITAEDRSGNAVTETIIRAYGLHP